MSSKLESLSFLLRHEIIFPSGGWLTGIVPRISDALGIWDILVLCIMFIASWVVLRVSDPLNSMIMGCTFDITIPLQHQFNPKLEPIHRKHLEGYWPIQMFAMGLEFLCFFMPVPEVFTLVVCLKTLLMTAIWLGRRADGSFLTARGTPGPKPGRTDNLTDGNRDEGRSSRGRSRGDQDAAPRRSREKGQSRPGDGSEGSGEDDPTKQKRRKGERSTDPPKDPSKDGDRSSRHDKQPKPSSDASAPPAAENGSKSARRAARDKKLPNGVVNGDDEDDPGFAPPGRGPPITEEEAAAQIARRKARHRHRGDRQEDPTVIKLGDGHYAYASDPEKVVDLQDPGPTKRERSRRPKVLKLGETMNEPLGASGEIGTERWQEPGRLPSPSPPPVPAAVSPKQSGWRRIFGRTRDKAEPQYKDVPIPPAYRVDGTQMLAVEPQYPVQPIPPAYGKDGVRLQEPVEDIAFKLADYVPVSITDLKPFRYEVFFKPEGGQEKQLSRAEVAEQKPTAIWEAVGEHDSIDLLVWFLREMGVNPTWRAWMIMDLLDNACRECARDNMVAWRTAYQTRDPSQLDLDHYARRSWDTLTWRPNPNNIWWDDPKAKWDQSEGRMKGPFGLDKFIWKLRDSGVDPPTRHAIVKSLMSAASLAEFQRIQKDALHAVNVQGFRLSSDIKDLQKRYLNEHDFGLRYDTRGRIVGRHWCMSADDQLEEFAEQTAKGRSYHIAAHNLTLIRAITISPPPKSVRALERYCSEQRKALQQYGEDIEEVFTKTESELFPGVRGL